MPIACPARRSCEPGFRVFHDFVFVMTARVATSDVKGSTQSRPCRFPRASANRWQFRERRSVLKRPLREPDATRPVHRRRPNMTARCLKVSKTCGHWPTKTHKKRCPAAVRIQRSSRRGGDRQVDRQSALPPLLQCDCDPFCRAQRGRL